MVWGMRRGAKELMPHTYSQQRSNCDFYLPGSGLVNKYPFCGLFTAMFPHFYALCWWVHLGLRHHADVLPNVWNSKPLWCALQRKHVTQKIFLQTWVIVLTLGSMLMNQQYTLNKVSESKIYGLINWWKCFEQMHSRTYPCIQIYRI